MRRISTPTAAQDLFGPGKHGFRNGDPANAILATRLQAEWFNALQEEVAGAVEQAGAALDPENSGQLSAAIEGVVDRQAPVATRAEAEESVEANANNTKRMTPLRVLQAIKARLINATETVVGMLRVGTQAEVNAGGLDNVAVTPNKLRYGFSASWGVNSYIVFPTWLGGMVIQFGSFTATAVGQLVAFPIEFPADCRGVFLSQDAFASTGGSEIPQSTAVSKSSFNFYSNVAAGTVWWVAFGK